MLKELSPVVTDKQNKEAEALSSKFIDAGLKRRATIDFTGTLFAVDYLSNLGLRTNSNKSLFRSARLYSDFQITDIYSNAHVIYVITTYGADTVRIPVIHKTYNVLPEAYLVVDLKMSMAEAEVKGVIYPEMLDNAEKDDVNYKIPVTEIQNIEPFIETLRKYGGIKPSVGRHLDCMNLFIPYIDGSIGEKEKITLIEHILTCETCKKRLIETIDFDKSSRTIKDHENFLTKNEFGTKSDFMKKIKASNQTETEVKGAIDVIYHDKTTSILGDETLEFKPVFSKKMIKLVSITCAALLLLIIIPAAFISGSNRSTKNEKTVQGAAIEDIYDYDEENSDDYGVRVPEMAEHKEYMAISKISWEVSSSVKDENQKNFLQQAGKSIRLNLENDLLLSSDIAMKERVKFDVKFLRNGTLDDVTVAESSGVDAVDEVIKQSVNNTLRYMRAPRGSFVGNKSGLTLVIDF